MQARRESPRQLAEVEQRAKLNAKDDARNPLPGGNKDAILISDKFGTSKIASIQRRAAAKRTVRLRDRPWYENMTRRTATTIAALALVALPVGIGLSSKKYIFAKIPFLKQLGLRLPASESAVLAVDANGLTIQSQNASAAAREDFERAAMAQLAILHRTYASWAANNEDLIGSLTIKLRVDKAGNVADIDLLAARLSNAAFTRVVLNEIRRWTFPAGGKESVEITIPLLFVPKGMDPGTVVQWERKTRIAERDGACRDTRLAPHTAGVARNVSTLSLRSPRVQRGNQQPSLLETLQTANLFRRSSERRKPSAGSSRASRKRARRRRERVSFIENKRLAQS